MKSRGSCSLRVCVSFLSFGEKKKIFFVVSVEKKKAREFFTREDPKLEQKSIKRTTSVFFSRYLERENKSLLRRSAARCWCDDENDE